MNLTFVGAAFAATVFGAMLLALELGRWLRERRHQRDPEGAVGAGVVEGGVFALLGLLLAFSFTGAATRFDARRHLALEEANAIGTAWLRLDLLPAADQPAVRAAMRSYVDARLRTHDALPDIAATTAAHREASALQQQLWTLAQAAIARDPRPQVAGLVVPALNAVFDLATARMAALRTHVPTLVLGLLLLVSILASVLAGYGMWSPAGRDWLHVLAFASVTALTVYVIMDLEFPSVGLIRVDVAEQLVRDARAAMQ